MHSRKITFFLILVTIVALLIKTSAPLFADSSNNVTASVTIPPHSSDFQFTFTTLDNKTQVSQNATLSYQITYGAKTSAGLSTNTTLVVDYSNDTSLDGTHVIDYVSNSATNAYSQTTPIIDTTNRTITWTITSLPQGTTDQTVSFSLKTNSNYTGSQSVPFTITAKMSNQYVSVGSLSVSQSYLYTATTSSSSSSSPTSTPAPQTTATTAPITPTPSPTQSTNTLNRVSITGTTDDQILLQATTKTTNQYIIGYGLSPTSLTQSIVTVLPDTLADFNLNGLIANTSYFFQITTIASDGTKTKSDIYTAKTAIQSTPPSVDSAVAVMSSNNTVIATNVKNDQSPTANVGIMPINTPVSITYTIPQAFDAKEVDLILRNKHVLGASTTSLYGSDEKTIKMVEKAPGIYVGDLVTPDVGSYDVFVHIADTKGNIVEKNITQIKVIQPLQVFDKESKRPLPDTRIFLYYFDNKQKKFLPLTKTLANVQNPSYTKIDGTDSIVLPAGQYKANVGAFGHEEKTISFVLGVNTNENYPKVYLQKDPWQLGFYLRYLKNAIVDTYTNLVAFLSTFAVSFRFFNLAAVTVVLAFIFLSFLAFSKRAHIPIAVLHKYFLHNVKNLIPTKSTIVLGGMLVDSENKPIPHAFITVAEGYTNLVVAHGTSNQNGKFFIQTKPTAEYHISYSKEGFLSKATVLPAREVSKSIKIALVSSDHKNGSLLHIIIKYAEEFISMFFEFFLFMSLCTEILFISLFGITLTLPFFLLSLFNIWLWIFFLRERVLQEFFAR